MNREECLKVLAETQKKHVAEEEKLKKRQRIEKQKILNQWANANARFKVGDILQMCDTIIKVTKFYGKYSNYYGQKLYVTYYGVRLTKKLTPCKDGSMTDVYDDGREIKKLK